MAAYIDTYSLWLFIAFLLIAALIFWPKLGIYTRWKNKRNNSNRILIEDALKHIHKSELKQTQATLQTIAGTLNISTNQTANLISESEKSGLLIMENGNICLTAVGREYALRIIRAHRLWERHLAENTGFSQTDWHTQAERHEHFISPDEADTLAFELGNPTHDPHGDPIPTTQGDVVPHGGFPLTNLDIDLPAKIVHIEDEPPLIFDQLLAEGLHPGLNVRLTEKNSKRIRFWTNEEEHVLAPLLANNISVIPIQTTEEISRPGLPLSELEVGSSAQILHITKKIRGPERRRLMDLGFLPGTPIETAVISPSGDPKAYRIRNTLIALRKEQAEHIRITKT